MALGCMICIKTLIIYVYYPHVQDVTLSFCKMQSKSNVEVALLNKRLVLSKKELNYEIILLLEQLIIRNC